MKNSKKTWSFLISLIIVSSFIFSFQTEAEETKKIRVGVAGAEGYHTISESGVHSGYDYEYLMEIAKYTDWEYEFVEGTWEECISRLKRGEIDLLGGVEKTEERQDLMDFGFKPSMYVTNCLLVERGSKAYAYEDFQAFDNIRIGGLRGSSMKKYLKEYSRENNFTYKMKLYDSEEELREALKKKEIDCICLSDARNLKDYTVIARFGYTQFYYVTNKNQNSLGRDLDYALRQIHTQKYYYESNLHEKYFARQDHSTLTKEEEEYVKANPKVEVVLFDTFPVICEKDSSGKGYKGIIIDALDMISQRTGLQFEYKTIPENVMPWEYLGQHPNAIVAPLLKNSFISYKDSVKLIDTVVESKMIGVSKKNTRIVLNEAFTLAIPEGMYGAESGIRKLFPKVHIVTGASHEECFKMVKDSKADMTLINEITGTRMLQSPYYDKLSVVNVDDALEDVTMAMSGQANPFLISVLNKGISSFSERDIGQMIVDNTTASVYQLSLGEWIYKNRIPLFLVVLFLITGSFTTAGIIKQKKWEKEEREQLRIAEERHLADQKYQKKMFRQANFDKLTGLYTHNYFVEKANELLRKNPEVVYSFFQLDIIKFKMINEIYGKERGDFVLQIIADKLRRDIGEKGIYGRIHSDNFIFCYPVDETTLKNIKKESTMQLECMGQNIRVDMKVGIYVNSSFERDVERILEYVQIAVQNTAQSDEEHFCYYKESYLDSMLRNQKITNEMENALKEEQFKVFLQPQFDHMAETLVGAEALVRWFHPTEGIIPPNVFIPLFEENGFIYKLDAYIFEKVCALLQKWNQQGKMVPVSVNFSRIDFQNKDILVRLQETIQKYSIDPQYIHLEITESAYSDNNQELFRIIEQCQKIGFIIEMDDFGSGYSSLNMLKDIPVDVLKLDLQFFSGETHMDKGGSIIEAIVDLAYSLGLAVIAEGVETEREANFLKGIQCNLVQGYLYGKPMEIQQFETFLKEAPIGEKQLGVFQKKNIRNRYWEIEKLNVLLRSTSILLFDYDPVTDCAVYIYVEEGKLKHRKIIEYSRTILQSTRVHPDDRSAIKQLFATHDYRKDKKEIEFRADRKQIGEYIWIHADIYPYNDRVIACIRPKES